MIRRDVVLLAALTMWPWHVSSILQIAEKQAWESARNRDRVSEILGMYMRNQQALNEALDLDDGVES